MGLEGVEVRSAGLFASACFDPALGDALAALGADPPDGAPREVTADLLEEAELVLCVAQQELEQVLTLTSVRAYTLLDYLGRSEASEPALDPGATLSPIERADRLAALARHVAEQIGRELESDPARPGAAARD